MERILVADDELYILDVCRRILGRKYDVTVVHSGLEAIQLAQEQQFDLLLTDIKMPGIDGLEAAQEVKKIQPDMMCVTMTGFSTMETAIKALRLGVDEFVIKPFAPEELMLAIDRAFEKERLRRENVRLKSLLPLFEFNKMLMSTTEIDKLLEQVTGLAISEVEADSVVLYLLAESGDFRLHSQRNLTPSQLLVLEEHGLKIAANVQNAPLYADMISAEKDDIRDVLAAMGMNSAISVPIAGQNKLHGMLMLFKSTGAFSQSQQNFLGVMAGQVAIAYENAKLFQDLQQAYDKLKSLDHLKSEFINVAAHELRTPLAILMGYASVAAEDATAEQREYMDAIVRNATRLRGLIDDLLNMRHIESGEVRLEYASVNLKKIIETVIDDVNMLARKKNITIVVEDVTNIPEFLADSRHLELILVNLLSNAIKFTPNGGSIRVYAEVSGTNLRLSVEDTGVGIPSSEFEKIFDRFYQVEDSRNRHHEGIGLGLAIVKGIIERCGGKIWVEKSEVGKGTTFTFTMPMLFEYSAS